MKEKEIKRIESRLKERDSVISAISVLGSLLTSSVASEEQFPGSETRYVPVFIGTNRTKIGNKIMELIEKV